MLKRRNYQFFKGLQMGRASGRKANRRASSRFNAFINSGCPTIPLEQRNSSILRWLRSIGVASILFGCIGVMQQFFWPSVSAFIFGLLIVLVDLYFENWGDKKWLKYFAAALIIVVLGAFLKYVVLRKDQLTVSYLIVDGRLHIILANMSDADYQSVDFKIIPDRNTDLIDNPIQVTSVPGVSFFAPVPGPISGSDEFGNESISYSTNTNTYKASFLRARADRISANSMLEISVVLYKPYGNSFLQHVSIDSFHIEGSYQGKFRTFAIQDSAITVSKP